MFLCARVCVCVQHVFGEDWERLILMSRLFLHASDKLSAKSYKTTIWRHEGIT